MEFPCIAYIEGDDHIRHSVHLEADSKVRNYMTTRNVTTYKEAFRAVIDEELKQRQLARSKMREKASHVQFFANCDEKTALRKAMQENVTLAEKCRSYNEQSEWHMPALRNFSEQTEVKKY